MQSRLVLAVMIAAVPASALAQGAHDNIDALIEQQAKANKVPAAFVHRVVKRESNYNPRAKGGSALGLMQIKHATARSMGYKGDAAGLYDPETNLKYGIAYLASAYRLARGDLDQAYRYYNRGFYYAAKKLGIETVVTVPDDVPATAPVQTASSSDGFSKLFGLSSSPPASAGSTALAYAAPAGQSAPIEVPLPPRRPAALGGGTATAVASAAADAPAPAPVTASLFAAALPAPSQETAAAATSGLIEVPLPPRRPTAAVLASLSRPVAVARKATASAEVQEATAIPAAQ